MSTATQRLADALLADRNKVKTEHNIIPCFSCGQTFVYRGRQGELNGRFCSMRCQDWYDAGNQPIASSNFSDIPLRAWRVVAGASGTAVGVSHYGELLDRRPGKYGRDGQVKIRQSSDGFLIPCANCRKEFDSIGSRCCSTDCERRYCERQRNVATMAEVGVEPVTKRVCANPDCLVVIPKWRNGRRVSSKTRFCSAKCKGRRIVLLPETFKRPASYGHFFRGPSERSATAENPFRWVAANVAAASRYGGSGFALRPT